MANEKTLNIFIVSDATGTTAESVVTSVLVHFKHHQFEITRFPFVRDREKLEETIDKATRNICVIVFTLVSVEMRKRLLQMANEKGLIVVDVMGPLIEIFSGLLSDHPKMEPGAFRRGDEDAFQLAEAIHFSLQHDDGRGMETIDQADLIILGLSRTGKTPTSVYLSAKKLKVANIPIIKDVPFPEEIIHLPVKKVGFRIDIDRLARLRTERVKSHPGVDTASYSARSYILKEQTYCEDLYRKIPSLLTLNITNRSIEETSEWITREVL